MGEWINGWIGGWLGDGWMGDGRMGGWVGENNNMEMVEDCPSPEKAQK